PSGGGCQADPRSAYRAAAARRAARSSNRTRDGPGAVHRAPGPMRSNARTPLSRETPRAVPCYAAPSVADSIALRCAEAALAAGREIRALVHAMDPRERAQERLPLLKPHGGYGARQVDAEAERVGLAHLEQLAADVDCALELIVDPAPGPTHPLGPGPP